MMLKNFVLLLGIILSVTACNTINEPKKPDNLISKNRMVDILIDARLLSSANSVNKKIMQEQGVKLDSFVYKKHGIDSLQFALSNEYYAFHVKEYEEIYNKVIDSLEKLKVVLKELENKEERERKQKVKDSINAIKLADSLRPIIKRDSLKAIIKKDSLKGLLKKKLKKEEGVLIKPVSDMKRQPVK